MLRTTDGRMEWVAGRERRLAGVSTEAVAVLVAAAVLLGLVL